MRTAIIVTLLVMTIATVTTKQRSCSNERSFIATEGIYSTFSTPYSLIFLLEFTP